MQSLDVIVQGKSAETILVFLLLLTLLGDLTTSRTLKVGMASKSFLINSSNKTLSFPLNLPTHDYSREIGVAIARQEPKLALCQIALLASSSSSHATVVKNQQKSSFETSKKLRINNS